MFRPAQQRRYGQYVASTVKRTQALKQSARYFNQIWILSPQHQISGKPVQ
jgi:hypothetical protein